MGADGLQGEAGDGPWGAFCTGLWKCTSLRTLSLAGCYLGDEGIAPLNAMLSFRGCDEREEKPAALEELDLARNRIGEAGAGALAVALGLNLGLRTLSLAGNDLGLIYIYI